MDYKAHLTERILPRIIADGTFGENVVMSKCDIKPVNGLRVDHWMSTCFTVSVSLRNSKTNAISEKHLLVKFQSAFCDEEQYAHFDRMTQNEETMYKQIIPFFEEVWKWSSASKEEPLGLFPKCYAAQSGEGAFVVLENLRAAGFRTTQSLTELDKAHVFLALRKLGQLHGLSYAAKVRRKDDFLALARLLRESNFTEEKRQHGQMLAVCALRRLEGLAARGEGVIDPATVDFLRERLENGYDLMMEAVRAEEPLSVITHGDFCRNNMLFKYDEETGQPVDVRFFDLQNSRYCSPAVDLSFFLLLNTSPSLRAQHWDDMFLVYYDGLSTVMYHLLSSGPGMSPTMEMPSLAALKADFARHALYGFILCAFFLPVMQNPLDPSVTPERVTAFAKDGGDVADLFVKLGGKKASDCLADLLLDMVQKDVIDRP